MKEFSPLDEFYRLFRYWWLIAICMLLGGIAAYGFHMSKPPLYEATTTLMATIDTQTFPFHNVREDLIQYNEDMALGTVEGALRSPVVTQALFEAAQLQGISLDANLLAQHSTIERKHAIWEVRYRDPDPSTAQTVVNLWMEIGFQAMQSWHADGRMPAYVLLDQPTPAYQPTKPIAYQLSNLLLAGCAAGFILGVMLTALVARPKSKPADAA